MQNNTPSHQPFHYLSLYSFPIIFHQSHLTIYLFAPLLDLCNKNMLFLSTESIDATTTTNIYPNRHYLERDRLAGDITTSSINVTDIPSFGLTAFTMLGGERRSVALQSILRNSLIGLVDVFLNR